jgi:cytochrome c-type biogenesis protein CcmH/NrfF
MMTDGILGAGATAVLWSMPIFVLSVDHMIWKLSPAEKLSMKSHAATT